MSAERAGTLALRLALFAAFAAFGALHWAQLVAGGQVGVLVATVALAVACGAALALLGRSSLPRAAVEGLAAAVVLAALAAGLVACGVAPGLLLPWGWSELAGHVDRSLLAVQTVDWPYVGPDAWVRTTILLGIPLLLTTAAALAFWPAPPARRPVLRATALVALTALYGIAVTTRDPGSPVLLGTLLLALIAAWLWLPRRRGRELALGAATVLAAGLLALPPALALDGDDAWLDYRSWAPFGARTGVAFGWDHSYGPLDWPRQGTTLLSIRSESPQYWKAQALNDFDGVRWYRSPAYVPRPLGSELPFDVDEPSGPPVAWRYGEPNPDWSHRARVEVRSLSTELVVGAGLTYDVDDVAAAASADGTTRLLGQPLSRGDSYGIGFYQPNPSPLQMAGAPIGYPAWLERYTEVSLPAAGGQPTDTFAVSVPLRGNRASASERAAVDARLAGSAYARTYALARRLTEDRTTVYAAVAAVEDHLLTSYRYSERVPERTYPLESFLFDDRRGYCQQFSGAMALMLRMVGIPARVAAGFSPGTRDEDSGEYTVRDLDAHSWVEVYFAGIGWVTFDPTPRASESDTAAPAAGRDGSAAAGVVRQDASDPEPSAAADPDERDDGSGGAGASASEATSADRPGSGAAGLLLGAVVALAALVGAAAVTLRGRRRTLGPDRLATAAADELRRSLERLGWDVGPDTTLLALERRLAAGAGPSAAAYARALRRCRFGADAGEPPGPAARSALRRDLAAGGGPLARLRALIALPPGGPL